MSQLKRYNGTSWETIGGSIAPKNTHTSSTTDTYSCNYVNDALSGDLVVDSIRTKNMFDKSTLVQNDITDMYPNLRITSRQVIWLEPGTYTVSTNMSSSYQWGIQIQNVGIPPLSTYPTYIFETGWLTAGTTERTFTINTAGWFTLMIRRSDNGSFTSTDLTNIKSYNYQLEEGNTATEYRPYQNLTGINDIYTTDERLIGSWLGKPLYRKVVSSTTPSQVNTGTNIYDASSLNIDRLVNLSFNFKETYNEYATASNIIIMFTRISGTDRQIACTCTLADYCNKPFYFILEYTKTTD